MKNEEIENRFLATMKNGKGITLWQFAKNNNLDFIKVFSAAFRLKKEGRIIEVTNGLKTTYYLND